MLPRCSSGKFDVFSIKAPLACQACGTWDVTKRGYAKSERLSPINYGQKLSAPGVCLDALLACGGLAPPAPPGQCGQKTSCVRRLGSGGGPRPACN